MPIKPALVVHEPPQTKPISPVPEPKKDKEKRKSKLMSSITGIFKHDHAHHKEVHANNSQHRPSCVDEDSHFLTLKETQI
jgi:hypothetical protein